MKNIHEEVFEMNYKKRIADEIIDLKTEVFGPINIVGPKGQGWICCNKHKIQMKRNRDNKVDCK